MPAQRIPMRTIREILRLKLHAQLSTRQVNRSLRVSVGMVAKVMKKAQVLSLDWTAIQTLDDTELANLFYPTADNRVSNKRQIPDWSEVRRELTNPDVTKMILWEEYAEQYPNRCLSYSQYCHRYRTWLKRQKRSMRISHKAGEKLFVDYAGRTQPIKSSTTGEVREAQIFVATMGASSYIYAEATYTQSLPDWIQSHVNCFNYLSAVPEIIVPDNLKSGVSQACKYDPQVNACYQQMAAHYDVAIIPARPYKPKDKSKAEVSVQIVERWILARIRKMSFFSLAELNQVIRQLLEDVNNRHSKHLNGSRQQWFETMDKPRMRPLPSHEYEYTDIKTVKVHIDYHVQYDSHYYSVPHHLVGEKLELHAKANMVEMYFKANLVATHARQYRYGTTTLDAHMPKQHAIYHKWSKSKILTQAKRIGPSCVKWVEYHFATKKHPEQAYRVCLGLLGLTNNFAAVRVNRACAIGNRYKLYRLKQIKNILRSNQDTLPQDILEPTQSLPQAHENIRGPQSFH